MSRVRPEPSGPLVVVTHPYACPWTWRTGCNLGLNGSLSSSRSLYDCSSFCYCYNSQPLSVCSRVAFELLEKCCLPSFTEAFRGVTDLPSSPCLTDEWVGACTHCWAGTIIVDLWGGMVLWLLMALQRTSKWHSSESSICFLAVWSDTIASSWLPELFKIGDVLSFLKILKNYRVVSNFAFRGFSWFLHS